jgi:hypothetical protein
MRDNDLGHHLLVGLLESRAGKRRDHLCDRLLGKLVELRLRFWSDGSVAPTVYGAVIPV